MVRPWRTESRIISSPSHEVKFSSTRCQTERPAFSLPPKGIPDQKRFQVPVPFLKRVSMYAKSKGNTVVAMMVFGRLRATPIPTIDILVSSTQRSKVLRNFFITPIVADKLAISTFLYK